MPIWARSLPPTARPEPSLQHFLRQLASRCISGREPPQKVLPASDLLASLLLSFCKAFRHIHGATCSWPRVLDIVLVTPGPGKKKTTNFLLQGSSGEEATKIQMDTLRDDGAFQPEWCSEPQKEGPTKKKLGFPGCFLNVVDMASSGQTRSCYSFSFV